MVDLDMLKRLQEKGIKISKNESCFTCGLEFDPKDLKNYFEMKFVSQVISRGYASHKVFEIRKCE
jgi:hypothetical protein